MNKQKRFKLIIQLLLVFALFAVDYFFSGILWVVINIGKYTDYCPTSFLFLIALFGLLITTLSFFFIKKRQLWLNYILQFFITITVLRILWGIQIGLNFNKGDEIYIYLLSIFLKLLILIILSLVNLFMKPKWKIK